MKNFLLKTHTVVKSYCHLIELAQSHCEEVLSISRSRDYVIII